MFWIDERRGGVEAWVDDERLRELVEALAVPRHRLVNSRGNALTREFVADVLSAGGFEVSIEGPLGNVLALPRRPRASLKLVSAHYDAVPDCPGADDNASGVAVMLACAEALRGGGHEVGFVAFNAEEDGMLGSIDFVDRTLPSLGRLEVAHVLEMVGASGGCHQRSPLPWPTRHFAHADFLGLLGKGASNRAVRRVVHSRAAPGLRVLGARTLGRVDWVLPDLRRSDHIAFWDQGLPAVMWTDTADFRNPHYHQPTDTPETLDYAFMHQVLELLVDEAAAGPSSP